MTSKIIILFASMTWNNTNQCRSNTIVLFISEKLVKSLFRDKLKDDLQLESIDRSHKVVRHLEEPDQNRRQRHRPIIMRFVPYYRDHHRIFEAKNLLKGGTGVPIRENLTAGVEESR